MGIYFLTDIDPEDDSTRPYGRQIFQYVQERDAKFSVSLNDLHDTEPKLRERREHLLDWLVSVAHHFRCSQETLYHTVDLIDRCLTKATIKTKLLQLLGVAAFLIATKVNMFALDDCISFLNIFCFSDNFSWMSIILPKSKNYAN